MDTGQVVVGVLVILAAYLIGGIPWGVVIARLTGGPDPRTIGSGRTGGANVMRALGPRLALASGLLDVGKGVVAVLLAIAVGGGLPLEILAALAAIVGHSRSIWIGFAGGRGIAPGVRRADRHRPDRGADRHPDLLRGPADQPLLVAGVADRDRRWAP